MVYFKSLNFIRMSCFLVSAFSILLSHSSFAGIVFDVLSPAFIGSREGLFLSPEKSDLYPLLPPPLHHELIEEEPEQLALFEFYRRILGEPPFNDDNRKKEDDDYGDYDEYEREKEYSDEECIGPEEFASLNTGVEEYKGRSIEFYIVDSDHLNDFSVS